MKQRAQKREKKNGSSNGCRLAPGAAQPRQHVRANAHGLIAGEAQWVHVEHSPSPFTQSIVDHQCIGGDVDRAGVFLLFFMVHSGAASISHAFSDVFHDRMVVFLSSLDQMVAEHFQSILG